MGNKTKEQVEEEESNRGLVSESSILSRDLTKIKELKVREIM